MTPGAMTRAFASRLEQARGLKLTKRYASIPGVLSRLEQARGLKHDSGPERSREVESRLEQARGLKQASVGSPYIRGVSRLEQARGLKQPEQRLSLHAVSVAPRAGAWIETLRAPSTRATDQSRASSRRVD